MAEQANPSTPSSDYVEHALERDLMEAMLEGKPAIMESPEEHLPKWENESLEAYRRRVKLAPFTPILEDIVFGLTSKPFTKEVALKDGASDSIKAFCEDVDGQGNNLHVFARSLFNAAVADGYVGILIDYPVVDGTLTKAQEAERNVRPYWVKIEADAILALYTEVKGGAEFKSHVRIEECQVVREGFGEKEVERVRVLEPGIYQVWEEQEDENKRKVWVMVEDGKTSLGIVPLVIFYTGERDDGPLDVCPPLINLARMQQDLFREEDNLQSVKTRTGYPMLAANGMTPPDDGKALAIGPGSVLFGGAEGNWVVLEPAGSSLEQLRQIIDEKKQEMRRLGMQPLLPGSGTVSATATGVEAAKAHSRVQEWALGLKDALEQCLMITGMWLKEKVTAEVVIHTDFGVDIQNPQSLQTVLAMRAAGDISRVSVIEEMKRHGVLATDFDADADQVELDAEAGGLPDINPPPPVTPPTDPGAAA